VSREGELRAALAEVQGAGLCSHPVRLFGTHVDGSTGELRPGRLTVACKDRRRSVCPACSKRYQADAWHLVAAGLRGGKGVPETVVDHPNVFVTLTAPSFGPVHSRPGDRAASAPCHPRRRAVTCPHGVVLTCTRRHPVGDRVLGEPLCAGCFDYEGAVLWNAKVPELWRRTTVALVRALAKEQHTSEAALRRAARISFVKAAELQRRGLVHLHVVVRLDGPDGPGSAPLVPIDADELAAVVCRVAASVSVPSPGSPARARTRWGTELDVRILGGDDGDADPVAIAAYTAKYATKSAADAHGPAHRLRHLGELERLGLRPHPATLVRTAWALGGRPELAALGLRRHAHAFGFPGHVLTKSRAYSTTFGALRGARANFAHRDETDSDDDSGDVDSAFDDDIGALDRAFDGAWRYGGRGYEHPDAERLAEALFGLDRTSTGTWTGTSTGPSTSTGSSTGTSTGPLQGDDQGKGQ